MRVKHDDFKFIITPDEVQWQVTHNNLLVTIKLTLTVNDVVERWSLSVQNLSTEDRKISVYPYFSVGYMSWMNQSANFDPELNAIVAHSITPYQKVDDYFKNKLLKDYTFLAANKKPHAWQCSQSLFEGEGGLHNPDDIRRITLSNSAAVYQQPTAVMQYRESLLGNESVAYEFIFGPAIDKTEITALRNTYFDPEESNKQLSLYREYIAQSDNGFSMQTGDSEFDHYINHWLPRQIYYHGDVNRLSTDPQTRNYIQDAMGMCFIQPKATRKAFITALSQQKISGAMPEGVLLHEDAELKYINQVPHADHGVWLPICLSVYLSETNDIGILSEEIGFIDNSKTQSFVAHIELALDYLLNATDHRGLSFIEQGDWCDPMNMVGYKGKGVSSWLSLATAYAIKSWCKLCQTYQLPIDEAKYKDYRFAADKINQAVNEHLWDGNWFGRGITDDNVVFGSHVDTEGRIYLNPQSFAMLSGAASEQQLQQILNSVEEQLSTPFGMMMLAPSYTKMREDVGRLTQKHPGVSENGSVYNHASVFYIFSLFQQGEIDLAFEKLKQMVPSANTSDKTGQLPLFIPNYYRGAYHQFPEQAGKSSHLFNTGTIAWVYRCIIEEVCGIKGQGNNIVIAPKLPKTLPYIKGTRKLRGITFSYYIIRADIDTIEVNLNGETLIGNVIDEKVLARQSESTQNYSLYIKVPMKNS